MEAAVAARVRATNNMEGRNAARKTQAIRAPSGRYGAAGQKSK